MSVVVATFYKFVSLADCEVWQRSLQTRCEALNLRGTILLATEGINATVAGSETSIAELIHHLIADPRLADLEVKTSTASEPPFGRLKVKVKSEIVTLGQPDADPNRQVGTYVSPADWNRLITDPDVVLVDARNDYEVSIGTFQGAINPRTDSFRQLPDYLQTHLDPQHHRKVAMFCTGGIRCEKATAYLLNQGFEAVYHLRGGILKYLEDVPETDSLWEGECFVFDERVTVKHGLQPGSYDLCWACGNPLSAADKRSPHYEVGVSCPHCYATLTPEKLAKHRMRQQQRDHLRDRAL